MTNLHKMTPDELKAEVERQRQGRLDVSMKNYELLEQIEDLKAVVDRTADLKGPDYACVCQSSNGQVWAYTRAQVREDWIRRFAGHALPQAMRISTTHAGIIARRESYDLWEKLEARFEVERAEAATRNESEATDAESTKTTAD